MNLISQLFTIYQTTLINRTLLKPDFCDDPSEIRISLITYYETQLIKNFTAKKMD